jgi:hypothetical protein
VANTAVSWPGRLRQIHSFFRSRSTDQMLATARPWTSPWLPPGYEQNFWNAAVSRFSLVLWRAAAAAARTLPRARCLPVRRQKRKRNSPPGLRSPFYLGHPAGQTAGSDSCRPQVVDIGVEAVLDRKARRKSRRPVARAPW